MPLETQRLTLRPWQPNIDARHVMDIYSDPRVMAWVDDGGRDTSIRQAQRRLQRYRDLSIGAHTASWAVEQKDIGRVIGHILLIPLPDIKAVKHQQLGYQETTRNPDGIATDYIEIGWHFRPASWGFGYATEAASCVIAHAFEQLNLPTLLAVTAPENRRSVALAERLGMQCDGLTARYYGGQAMLLYKLSNPNSEPASSAIVQSEADDAIALTQ